MKVCSNCSTNVENCVQLKLSNSPLASLVVKNNGKLEKVNAFVCPNCGKLDLYVNLSGK